MRVFRTSPARPHFLKARHQFGLKKYDQAIQSLGKGFLSDFNYKPLYRLAATIYNKQDAIEEKQLFQQALHRFYLFQPFYQLGYHFIDRGNYAFAQAFLEKAFLHNPASPEIAYELSHTLTARFQQEKALEVMQKIDYSSDFWLHYRYQFCCLLNQKTDSISTFINNSKVQLSPNNQEHFFALLKLEELEEQMLRLLTLKNGASHLRDWQFAQYGTSILDCNTNEASFGGRYSVYQPTMIEMRNLLEKLCMYLAAMQCLPEKIIALADRNSRIIGKTIARLLHIEEEAYQEGMDIDHCLVVAADSSMLNGMDELLEVKNNQRIFACYTHWQHGAMICPDISGFLAMEITFPWETEAFTNTSYYKRQDTQNIPSSYISDILSNYTPKITADFESIIDYYLSLNTWMKGGSEDNAKRMSFSIDSPVKILPTSKEFKTNEFFSDNH